MIKGERNESEIYVSACQVENQMWKCGEKEEQEKKHNDKEWEKWE